MKSPAHRHSRRKKNEQKAEQLMDFLHSHPDAYIRFYASDVVLHIGSNAAYLVAPKAWSRVAGYFHMSNHPNKTKRPKLNGAILVECKTLQHVVSSSTIAEVSGIFHKATTAIPIRHILNELGHPQPATPLKTDNSTATGFVYDNIHQKRSKSWDMRYHWLRDCQTQNQFNIFWEKGANIEADYFTKHHPTAYHRAQRSKYVRDKLQTCLNLLSLQGCLATSRWRHTWHKIQVSQDSETSRDTSGYRTQESIDTCIRTYVHTTQKNLQIVVDQ